MKMNTPPTLISLNAITRFLPRAPAVQPTNIITDKITLEGINSPLLEVFSVQEAGPKIGDVLLLSVEIIQPYETWGFPNRQ